MIVELTGTLRARLSGSVVVEAGGVGYGVAVSAQTERKLPPIGARVHLYTHLIIREDAWVLVGFETPAERGRFLDLLSVTGVGVKHALAVLSDLGVEGLEQAVRDGNWRRLAKVTGIGPRTAQRIQLELAGRWKVAESEPPAPADNGAAPADPVMDGLVALGFSAGEALEALSQVPGDLAPEERLRLALQRLDRRA